MFRLERRSRTRRALTVTGALALAAASLFVVSMMIGSSVLGPGAVLRSVLGLSADPSADFIVRELRLPRAATAVLVGLALGAAGNIFQRVLRNPLAAPDIIGISAGASTATVAGLVLLGAGGFGLSVAGLAGALATATAVYLLAWRGGIADYRFVLIGVGVAALLQSVTGYLVSRAEISDARAAMTWLVGSAGIAGTAEIAVLAIGCAVVIPVLMALSRRLGVLELGADSARGLGVRPQADTALQLGCAVVLVALATAAAGPIGFVALMAGPIAARLLGSAGDRVLASALVGAIIVQTADLAAQHLLPYPISTGIVTGLAGAPYIAWLLIRTDRPTNR
jgi:iron complex transport system permease protein